jgi:hypothetical protein
VFVRSLGRSLQNNEVSLVAVNGEYQIHVGCRALNLSDAAEYWGKSHRNQTTAEYMCLIVAHAKRIAEAYPLA